jgi:hypothetical protein
MKFIYTLCVIANVKHGLCECKCKLCKSNLAKFHTQKKKTLMRWLDGLISYHVKLLPFEGWAKHRAQGPVIQFRTKQEPVKDMWFGLLIFLARILTTSQLWYVIWTAYLLSMNPDNKSTLVMPFMDRPGWEKVLFLEPKHDCTNGL